MAKVALPIANGFSQDEVLALSNQLCINLYPNITQAPALSQENLRGTPGLDQLMTTGDFTVDVNRGAHVKNDVAYEINGTDLVRVESDLETFTVLGMVEGEGRVSTADNGSQLMIVTQAGKGYIFNEDAGTPFLEITDVDFTTTNGTPQKVVFLDGFFVVTTDSKKFKISSLNDGLTWNALDFGTAEADPDAIVAPHVHQNRLYIMGTETIEPFQNIGGSDFPFQRVPGGIIDKGLFAEFSIIETNSAFVWIGSGENEAPAIWRSSGGIPEKISTTAIENLIQSFTPSEVRNTFAWSYAQRGGFFIGFTLGNTTIVFDSVTSRWHERKSVVNGLLTRCRVNSMILAYGEVLVGDAFDGRIGKLSQVNNEYGADIFRQFSTQPFANQGTAFFNGEIELTIQSGVGNSVVKNPQARMDYSDDGVTFDKSTPRWRSMGKVGEYFRRLIWRRLGDIPRFRVFRFTFTDQVTTNIIGLDGDFSG